MCLERPTVPRSHFLAVLLLLVLGSCASQPLGFAPSWDASSPVVPVPAPSASWALPPPELETLMREERFEVVSRERAPRGMTGPRKLEVYYPKADLELRIKWKPLPQGARETLNNAPRKELAAYEVQKLFLDPSDYVVPTTVLVSLPFDEYDFRASIEPTIEGTNSVLGIAAYWLRNVEPVRDLLDEERFLADPIYAYNVANLNVLTYLIGHRDNHFGNFLLSTDEADPRLYSVDNGVAFDSKLYNFFLVLAYEQWNVIRVPALSRRTVERLRGVTRADLDRALGRLADLEVDADGHVRVVSPDPSVEAEMDRPSEATLRLGLTSRQIDKLEGRIRKLLQRVDAGEIPLF